MLKLYFNYIQLKAKSINIKNGSHYLLINGEFFKKYKDYYDYSTLENLLSKNNVSQQVVKNIKENQNYILNDKMLTIIIKNLSNDINQKFNEKSKNKFQIGNIREEPLIKSILNPELFYYDEFELIDKELYSLIFKKNNIGIYGECYFINDCMCIKMPTQINQKKSTQIYIFGSLNINHTFKATHLLEYNSVKDFEINFNYANKKDGFDKYINSFEFKNNYKNIVEANDIISVFSMPPLIGLKQENSFTSMNATLQCFCQIKKFVNYFKYNKHLEQILNNNYANNNKTLLVKAFKNLIENLWPSNYSYTNSSLINKNEKNKFYNPIDFKNHLISINNILNSSEENKCKDIIEFIIMNLHEGLNKKNSNNNNIGQNIIRMEKKYININIIKI